MTTHPDENRRRYLIIMKVLNSKRLLSDHIEILEDFLNLRQIQESHYPGRVLKTSATTFGTLTLAGAATGIAITSSGNLHLYGLGVLGVSAIGLGVLASYQWKDIYDDRQDMQRLSKLLDSLSQFHSLLKRNLTYLTDSAQLSGTSERDMVLATSSVDSLIEVIKLLHHFVAELDKDSLITKELVNYQPFEDLGNCDAFLGQDCPVKNLKSIYTIFLYIQSQFLLRTTVALIDRFPGCMGKDLENITKDLLIQVGREDLRIIPKVTIKGGRMNIVKFSSNVDKGPAITGDGLGKLKWTAMNLSTKLMVQLNQFERFNEKLTELENISPTANKKKLHELNDDLSTMESLFVSSACDFENVQILLKKILNIDQTKEEIKDTINENKEQSELPLIAVVDQSTAITIDNEFFILDGQMADKDGNATEDAPVDDLRNERVLKSSFKPVLKQLLKQIDPLNEEMAERERKFLQGQGVEVPAVELMKPSAGLYSSSTESDDEELDDDMVLRKKKFTPKPSKYDDNRQFLQEKLQNMELFRLPPPMLLMNRTSSEDVLE